MTAVRLTCSVLVLATSVMTPTRLDAQERGLAGVEELMRIGRTEAARALLGDWWSGDGPEATREDQQRALWLRGRLTVDPVQAQLDYQRLVVLYPAGPFTDRALLRLAQAAHSLGDGETAARHVADLVRDYPDSPARRDAEAWLASAGPPPPRRVVPAVDLTSTRTDPGGGMPDRGPTLADPGDFSVQLGAFGEVERARALFNSAVARGLAARIVQVEGSPLYHVRIGSFEVRERAQALLEELARAGFSAAVVRDSRREANVPG